MQANRFNFCPKSGSGKSALAKRVAVCSFPRFVWLTGANLNYANEPAFEHALGLAHPLTEVLRAAPESLVVLDGAEGTLRTRFTSLATSSPALPMAPECTFASS